jgi:hypothetical protein
VGDSLVSPGSRLVLTKKMNMLSSSHSTLKLTILSFHKITLSTGTVLEELGLEMMDCQAIQNPIMSRVKVVGQILIVVIIISLMIKMELTH